MTTDAERLNWTLQHYSIGHLIASGHFGVVYQARHLPTGRDVALKLIPLQGQDSDEKVAAERHGALLQQRFAAAHPGLVPEVFEHQIIVPFYAIAMELMHGRQLTAVIAEGPLEGRRAAGIALAIATFMSRAHQFETDIEQQHYSLIVHADLKPDHVLLMTDGSIRVLDFGIAKALAARTLVTTNKWGSIQYSSPERLHSDGQVNEQADFWSLGVMLFEMVAGYRPYRAYEHNASLLDNAIRRQEPREALPPATPPPLVAIIGKLLAPQIERRYESAEAIGRDLSAFIDGLPTTAGLEHAQASVETIRLPKGTPTPLLSSATLPSGAPRRPDSVPTEPLPSRQSGNIGGTESPATPAHASAAAPPRPLNKLPVARALVLLICFLAASSEVLGMMQAGRFRRLIPGFEISDLNDAKREYDDIESWTPLGIGAAMVRGRLVSRIVELADRTILEYRNEKPAVAKAQWEQAKRCLDLALQIAPSNDVAGKSAYVRGQLARIGERYDEAIVLFRTAARLSPADPDPYLGLATIYAYVTFDLDGFNLAVVEAARRGAQPNRRVRAWSGDLYSKLGDRAVAEAGSLTGDERTELLHKAVEDYGHCIEFFTDLRLFDSAKNLRTCRRRLNEVTSQLPASAPSSAAADTVVPAEP